METTDNIEDVTETADPSHTAGEANHGDPESDKGEKHNSIIWTQTKTTGRWRLQVCEHRGIRHRQNTTPRVNQQIS